MSNILICCLGNGLYWLYITGYINFIPVVNFKLGQIFWSTPYLKWSAYKTEVAHFQYIPVVIVRQWHAFNASNYLISLCHVWHMCAHVQWYIVPHGWHKGNRESGSEPQDWQSVECRSNMQSAALKHLPNTSCSCEERYQALPPPSSLPTYLLYCSRNNGKLSWGGGGGECSMLQLDSMASLFQTQC